MAPATKTQKSPTAARSGPAVRPAPCLIRHVANGETIMQKECMPAISRRYAQELPQKILGWAPGRHQITLDLEIPAKGKPAKRVE